MKAREYTKMMAQIVLFRDNKQGNTKASQGAFMKTTEQIEHDKNLRRVVVSSLVGAVIEWYDFFLYGVVAGLIFNHLYFPEFDDRIGTMLAFATFAVGFVARPLGGLVFGHFGDKIGRKKVLVLTLMIMGTGTVAIGCIPSYASIGIWAPILLILCRVAQGSDSAANGAAPC